jgi:hypothetical protein
MDGPCIQGLSVAALANHNNREEDRHMWVTERRLDRFAAQWFDICAGRDSIPENETTKQRRIDWATALIIQFLAIED